MNIELGEPSDLQGFELARCRQALVCIEAHCQTRQWILDDFASHQHVLVGEYLEPDPLNLWFKPLAVAP